MAEPGMSWDTFRHRYGESREEHERRGSGTAGGDALLVEERRSRACARGQHQRPNSAGRCFWCLAPLAQEGAA